MSDALLSHQNLTFAKCNIYFSNINTSSTEYGTGVLFSYFSFVECRVHKELHMQYSRYDAEMKLLLFFVQFVRGRTKVVTSAQIMGRIFRESLLTKNLKPKNHTATGAPSIPLCMKHMFSPYWFRSSPTAFILSSTAVAHFRWCQKFSFNCGRQRRSKTNHFQSQRSCLTLAKFYSTLTTDQPICTLLHVSEWTIGRKVSKSVFRCFACSFCIFVPTSIGKWAAGSVCFS